MSTLSKKSAILSLETAVPVYRAAQSAVAEKMAAISGLNEKETRWLKKIYENSSIKYRHSVVEAFTKEVEAWSIFAHKNPLTTHQRNLIYKTEAPKLAYQAAEKALHVWGEDRAKITHIIFISCTGVVAPGIQAHLQQALGLRPDINQTGMNMMGCFGAFKGLDLANAYVQQNPEHTVLVVCCELCTLHLQASNDPEHQVGNALFADGAAACVVGIPSTQQQAKYHIEKTTTYCLEQTASKMTWEVTDTGFVMGLKSDIPLYVEKHIPAFVQQLLPKEVSMTECSWAIHPGGKQILRAAEKALQLENNQLHASWQILENYGNMSSATFLFVLKSVLQQKKSIPWTVGVGFGPGLMLEGILLSD